MPLYRALEPLSYTDGDRVISVSQVGAVISLTTAQATILGDKIEYVGSGSDPSVAPRASVLLFDNLATFPAVGSDFHLYLDQYNGELYRWRDGVYHPLLGIEFTSVDWTNVLNKPGFMAVGDTAQDARDEIDAVGTGDIHTVATTGSYTDLDDVPSEFPPEDHTHPIADISATGTPSATTYLRGDGAWVTPAGGGTMVNVSDDTSPTLGGDLDVSTFKVGDATAADLAKLNDITASATELNVLDGITASTAELNYVDGVTSAIQSQLDAKPDTGDIPTGLTDLDTTVTGAQLDALKTKVGGIEALADVTDATNVEAAGAVMVADASTSGYGFVIDEDNMSSNSATKVPTQQSVKAYVDANAGSITLVQTAEKTSSYTAAVGEQVLVNATTNLAVTMPPSPTNGALVGVYIRAGSADVTLNANTGQELFRDGSTTTSLALQGTGGTIGLSLWRYHSTGAFWALVSYTLVPSSVDIVDSGAGGRQVLTSEDLPAVQDLLNIVSGADAVGARTWVVWVGSEAEYSSIPVKSDDTIYLRT